MVKGPYMASAALEDQAPCTNSLACRPPHCELVPDLIIDAFLLYLKRVSAKSWLVRWTCAPLQHCGHLCLHSSAYKPRLAEVETREVHQSLALQS
jgi:hypothetical protein